MVGVMTLTWAWAENALTLSIAIIDSSTQSAKRHPELPRSLKNKLSYLKAALRDHAQLEALKESGAALIEHFTKLKMTRGELVHGSAWQMDDGRFQTLAFILKGRDQTINQKVVEIGDIVRFNVEVTALSDRANAFLIAVSDVFAG